MGVLGVVLLFVLVNESFGRVSLPLVGLLFWVFAMVSNVSFVAGR